MSLNRRDFFRLSASGVGIAALTQVPGCSKAESHGELPETIASLKPMIDGVIPIGDDERAGRIERAQEQMRQSGIDAIYLEPGSSLFYFTGIKFWRSERMVAMILRASGEPIYIFPKFEEEKARELIKFGNDIRTWEEHESPFTLAGQVIKETNIKTLGIEETVRYFLTEGIAREVRHASFVNATPVTAGCRVIKSKAELALMQRANDITIEAYRAGIATLKEGMTQREFAANCKAAFDQLGAQGYAFTLFGKYSAFPHGSSKIQYLREDDIVLMDGGCKVEGYSSDISRTFVFGQPSQRQREIWDLEKQAQDAAFEAVKPGVACEAIDAAARAVITKGGFGPDYKYFTHRVGHGIGLDGHEWTYLVRGNKTTLAPGMCFSDEPGIYIHGEFGVRLEDCFYVTENGAKFFTKQSRSIDEPFA